MSHDPAADAPVRNPARSDHDTGVAPARVGLANLGLRHVALWVEDRCFDATVRFYRECMQLAVVWQPDADNVYLGTPVRGAASGTGDASTGMDVPVSDNLAIHRRAGEVEYERGALDHLGFCMPDAEAVQAWEQRITAASESHGVRITQPFKRHRDGSSSFYFRDPAGHLVQLIHVPNIRG